MVLHKRLLMSIFVSMLGAAQTWAEVTVLGWPGGPEETVVVRSEVNQSSPGDEDATSDTVIWSTARLTRMTATRSRSRPYRSS